MARKKSRWGLARWSTSVLALVPMLLWPCFVRASCCCTERDQLLERLIAAGALATVPPADDSTDSIDSEPVLEAKFACPMCCAAVQYTGERTASDAHPENVACSAMARCKCQAELQTASLAPRIEISQQAGKKLPLLVSVSFSNLHKSQALTSVQELACARIPLTSIERCALTCCWQN